MADSSWAARIVYAFDGSDGCDRCQAFTGLYDDPPALPHPYCDCTMYSGPIWGFQSIIYKNKVESATSEYEMAYEAVAEYYNETSSPVTVDLQVSQTITGEVGVSVEVEEVFGVSGKFSGSRTVSETVHVTVEPNTGVAVDILGLLKTVQFSADKYAVYEPLIRWGGPDDAPDAVEVFLTTLEDNIDAVTGHRVVVRSI